jgi:hypothetical protein
LYGCSFEEGRRVLEELLRGEVVRLAHVRSAELHAWNEGVIARSLQLDVNPSSERINEVREKVLSHDFEHELKYEGEFIYVDTSMPYFVGQGTHQGVVSVGDEVVAKGRIDKAKPSFRAVPGRISFYTPFRSILFY